MKKLVLLVCVFVLLIVATGAASAHNPDTDQFTINGITDTSTERCCPTASSSSGQPPAEA